MDHFHSSLLIHAAPSTVYSALSTPAGLRGWWTEDCDVATAAGGTHRLRFGPHHKDLRVELLAPDREVRWRCTDAHMDLPQIRRKDEWVGTEIVFRLHPQGNGLTRLEFEHLGLVPALECFDICNEGWRHFIASLQQYAETGRGTPHELAASSCH